MKALIPWYARIAAMIALAWLPVPYSFWKRMGVYSLGEMHQPDYVFRVFKFHLAGSGLSGRSGLVGLEMGPGDSAASAVIAKAAGFSAFHLVDSGDYANRDVEIYKEVSRTCLREGLAPPDIERIDRFDDILPACNATYSTHGLKSYREIPTESVDFIFSQAVMEHVRRHEFVQVAQEMRRILKPDGVASHQVDLQDHLGGALNNMRISSRWWESEWMARSSFYTNRIRFAEMCGIFERAGFLVDVVSTVRWDTAPISIEKLVPEFRHHSQEDLRVSSFHVLLRPRPQAG